MVSMVLCSLGVLVTVLECGASALTENGRHAANSATGAWEPMSLPRLFYINDHGPHGCDPDNEQTLIHLLFHADMFEWEGILADGGTNCATRAGFPPGQNYLEVLDVLDAYASDFPTLQREHAAAKLAGAFPSPATLRSLVVQGVNVSSPEDGLPPVATAGSRALVRAARRDDARPLWVVTGGSLSDVSRALHDAPEIASKIRLYSVGSWNTQHDPWARRRISQQPGLWWIEANTTFRGVYEGGNQTGQYNDVTIVSDHIAPAGAMGALYKQRSPTMKEGDMAGLYYLMGPDGGKAATDPTAPHWGGQYRLVSNSTPLYWSDLLTAPTRYPEYLGAQTVSQWRTEILDLWLSRLRWLSKHVAKTHTAGAIEAGANPYGFSVWDLNATEAALVKGTGAGWVRFQYFWQHIQPTRDTWHWDPVDAAIKEANAAGIKVNFDILIAPDWALEQTCDPTRPDKKVLPGATEFAKFASVLAKRFDGNDGRPYIDAYEVGNEEFDNYWGGNWTASLPCRQPQLYAPVLKATYQAIKAVSPKALVGFSGLWWLDEHHFRSFYKYFADNQLTEYFDFANFHYYPCSGSPLDNSSGLSFRQVLSWVHESVPSKPVWMTEFGWTVSNHSQSGKCIVSPAKQAEYMADVFDAARTSGVMDRVFWYTINPPWGNDGMSLTKYEVPTSTYHAYQKYTSQYPAWKTDDDDTSACTSMLNDLCPQHVPTPACELCAGTRQHPLRNAGCSHADIVNWCSAASSVRLDHPRIFFTAEIIAATRANIAAHPDLAAVYQKLKSRAMWDSVGGVSWNVQDHASMIALTYLIETDASIKTTLFTKLLAGMDALPAATTDEWTTGLTAWAMAVMYDATYNELTAAQRTKYAADIVNIADRVYTYYRHGDYNNHVYCEYGPLIYPGLALANDGLQDEKAAKYLNFTSDFLANHGAKTFAQVGETDGGWPEGRSYHALFVHWFSQQLWAWKIATNIDLFPNATGLRGDATWMTQTSLPHDNQPVAVADINTNPNTPKVNSWDESFYYLGILAREYQDGIAQYASNASGFGEYEFRLWPYVISHDPTLAPQLPSSLPTAALYEGIGWAPMRSDWSTDATFGMFVCGRYFAGHQHHDQNQFIIHKKGTLAIDAGEYGARATECHNTIRIGGNQRMDGMPNGNDPMRYVGDPKIDPGGQCYTGSILAYQHAPQEGWTYVAGNATAAYDASKVSEFTRQFVYLRPDLFIVYDRTATLRAEQREWMLHSLEPASLNMFQQEVTIANGNGTLWAKMLHPTGELPIGHFRCCGATFHLTVTSVSTLSYRVCTILRVDVQLTQYQMNANHDPTNGYDQQKPRNDNYIKFAPASSPVGRQDFVSHCVAFTVSSSLF
jgi:hypothetical protein